MKAFWMLALCALSSCKTVEDSQLCRSDEDCVADKIVGGTCRVAPVSRLKFCVETDGGCTTGVRWSEQAGDGLAGQCVAEPETMPDAGDVDVDAAADAMVDAATGGAP